MSKPFKIYKSSAGSGKTYTLVLTYLTILLQHKDPYQFRKVLAVTFTNKAANEMKDRVLQGLEKLQSGIDSRFTQDYVSSTKLSSEEIAQRSAEILTAILHDYSSFNIVTIDKFVHRIIRSFSRELGLTNNFELETNSDEFYKRSIDQLLDNVGVDKQLTDFLVAYNQSLFDEEKSVKIESSLLDLSKLLGKENSKDLLDFYEDKELTYFIETRKKLSELIKEKRAEIIEKNNSILQLFEQAQLNPEELKNGNSKLGSIFISYKEADFYKEITEPQFRNISEGKWMSESGKKTNPTMGSFVDQNGDVLTKNTLALFNEINALKFLEHIHNELVAFSLLNAIKSILEVIKKDNNIIFIKDFNEIISNVIQNEQTPYIYEKIGNRFSHFLIDEFQDTSTLQWHNLVPLIYDSLASNQTNLIVGDAKQAIYRFRGGEVDQFISLPHVTASIADIHYINDSFERNAQVAHLDKNYRSAQEIIHFNNWFFDHFVMKNDLMLTKVKEVYADSSQLPVRTEIGLVHIDFITNEKEEKEESNSVFEKIHSKVEGYILDCLNDGYRLDDICILVRSKKEGHSITKFLVEKGYNIVSVDSILIGNSQEVLHIMHHFQAINHPIDAHIIKCLLHQNEKNGLSPTELFEKYRIAKEENPYYSKGFQFENYLKEQLVDFQSAHYSTLSIFDKIDYLIEALGYKRTDPFIDKLLNVAFEFMRSNGSNANLFISHFFENGIKEQVNAKNAAGSIQLMTIHKSKGLQFPIVIIPYDFGGNNQSDLGWIGNENTANLGLPVISSKLNKKLIDIGFSEAYLANQTEMRLDNVNLYYVAFTRPEDRLYFIQNKRIALPKEVYTTLIGHSKFDADKNQLVIGEREIKMTRSIVEQTFTHFPHTSSWRETIELSPTKSAIDVDLDYEEISESDQLYGQIVHEIIAQNQIVSKLVDEGKKYLAQKKINHQLHESIINCLSLLSVNELFNTIFEHAEIVFKEREIIGQHGQILRPDLIIYSTNTLYLIDFKTGKPKKSHVKQVEQYAEELQLISVSKTKPTLKLQKYLIYLSPTKIDLVYV